MVIDLPVKLVVLLYSRENEILKLINIGKDALKIGANVFQFFTRNPRGSKAKDIDP